MARRKSPALASFRNAGSGIGSALGRVRLLSHSTPRSAPLINRNMDGRFARKLFVRRDRV